MLQYIPVEEECFSPEIGPYRSFGIAAVRIAGGEEERLAYVADVSPDREMVAQLATSCTTAQLDPVHLIEVVLDAL